MLPSQADEMEARVFPSVIGLHVSQLSLVLVRGSHGELQLSKRHSAPPKFPEVFTGRTAILNK
jgi:hypothetical protein